MTEYVKHRYSGRIYQIMRDHGPDNPYLWSPWDFASRYPSQDVWNRFFVPCEKPEIMPKHYAISIPKELEWEKRRLFREEPLVVKAPEGTKPKPRKGHREEKPQEPEESKEPTGEYTLADLCGELGMSPAKARKLLRSKGKKPPEGGWKWSNKEAAKSIKRFLRKF